MPPRPFGRILLVSVALTLFGGGANALPQPSNFGRDQLLPSRSPPGAFRLGASP